MPLDDFPIGINGDVTGVALSAVLMAAGVLMLWVAFISFVYSLLALWLISYLTERLPEEELETVVYQLQNKAAANPAQGGNT